MTQNLTQTSDGGRNPSATPLDTARALFFSLPPGLKQAMTRAAGKERWTTEQWTAEVEIVAKLIAANSYSELFNADLAHVCTAIAKDRS